MVCGHSFPRTPFSFSNFSDKWRTDMARKYYQPTFRRRRENDPQEEREHAQLRKELQDDLLRTREEESKGTDAREELRQLLT
jgi:hypothetical protein